MDARWTRRRWTRRNFAASLLVGPGLSSQASAAKGDVFPSGRVRFADPSTELDVIRLTDPSYSSILPPPQNRAASSRGGFLIYSSDHGGSMQICRLDVRSGESRVLTEAKALIPESPTLLPDEKSVAYFDGNILNVVAFSGNRDREIYRCADHATFTPGISVSDDGLQAATIVRSGEKATLMLVSVVRGGAQPVIDVPANATRPMLRPKRAAVLYRTGDGLWLVGNDGTENRRLKTTGDVGHAVWSPDGRSILYMSGNELREHTPDSNTDAGLAKTSQFASFGRNSDGSVFVGASRSKAGPYVLLLVRYARRELAICEHRCSNPENVNPVFAPSSQRIYFQSDRSGKMAIYTMAVERLVEKTEESSA